MNINGKILDMGTNEQGSNLIIIIELKKALLDEDLVVFNGKDATITIKSSGVQ